MVNVELKIRDAELKLGESTGSFAYWIGSWGHPVDDQIYNTLCGVVDRYCIGVLDAVYAVEVR